MSFENLTPAAEKEPKFLSLEEVKAKIEKLCGQENPEVIRTLEDGKGVYLHEVVTIDDKGDASLFSYRRPNDDPKLEVANTLIDITYFEGSVESGMSVGGHTLSNYDETSGEWTDTK